MASLSMGAPRNLKRFFFHTHAVSAKEVNSDLRARKGTEKGKEE
jgi:hypothetical protein